MPNQNPLHVISKSEQGHSLELKHLKVFALFIAMVLALFALKYKQGEMALFKAEHARTFALVGLSLNVYFVTWVAMAVMKTPTHSTRCLSILIWHISYTCGALTCGLLSLILFPYGWVIFFFYSLLLRMAPCEPHLRVLRWLRPPLDTQQDEESIAVTVEEMPALHLPTSTLIIQDPISDSLPSISEEVYQEDLQLIFAS
ncbi:hypothetical protein PVL29_019711 [Vitis rotundifolia]|uniref:Uncharacterized protein n=1 Tax=Vitis rotundifolia TaxID=103349 RepID=A0AA38Z156_VITRO|nr:hypothetical protein PVL29_019711 [Vitis rotundifolia]